MPWQHWPPSSTGSTAFHGLNGGVNIVISNAVARLIPERSQSEQADEFLDVANGGTHAMLRAPFR